MRVIVILFVLLILSSLGQADTIYVPGQYATIQEGIDAAMTGDTVLVSPGTFRENISFLGKAITVRGQDPADHQYRKPGSQVRPGLCCEHRSRPED